MAKKNTPTTLEVTATAQINRQVKRNIERFPEDFMFQLTKEDAENLKCQNGTSSWGGDRRTMPLISRPFSHYVL